MTWFPEARALDGRVWSLAAARTVATAGYSIVMPLLSIHLAVERRVPAFAIGAIWATAGGLSAVAQWTGGELCDRWGRRRLMVSAMFMRGLNLAAMGIAVARQSPVLIIGLLVVLNAVLRAFFDPVTNAMVADLTTPGQRVDAYSLMRVGTNVGFAAGPALNLVPVSYATLFAVAAPVTLLATAVIATIKEPERKSCPAAFTPAQLLTFLGDKAFLKFLLATVAFFILQVQLFQTTSIYAARFLHLGRAEVATLYVLNGSLVVLLQLGAVRYIRHLGPRRALTLGCLGYAASYAAVGLVVGHGTLLACIVAVTLAEIFTSPAQQTAVATLAPEGRQGAYAGLYGFCQVLGQTTGPLIGTALLDSISPRAAWFVLALFGIGAAIGYGTGSPIGAVVMKPLPRQGGA